MPSRRPRWPLSALSALSLLALLIPFLANGAWGQPAAAAAARTTSVTSITGDEATIDAGADAGLAVGTELRVARAGVDVGRIVLVRVENSVATGRAFPYVNQEIRAGDTALLPTETPEAPALAPSPPRVERPRHPEQPSYGEASRTIVPWESWEYAALSALAVDGLLPGYATIDFQSTRLYTRVQIAELVALAISNLDDSKRPGRDTWFLKRLVASYQHQPPVRALLDDLPEALTAKTEAPPTLLDQVTAWGGARLQNTEDFTDGGILARADGIFDLGNEAWAYLSLNNLHDLTSSLPGRFSEIDSATVNARLWGADWTLGKQSLSSGPVYSGDGLLSNNSPGIWQGRVLKKFSLGRWGQYTFSQLYGGYPDTQRTKYFGLRTIDTTIGKWTLGVAESYISTKAPNPLVLVLPYYGYQHWSIFGGDAGSRGNDTFNYMAQVNVAARVWNRMSVYGEFILDDISAPGSLGQGHVPRKVALVGGIFYPGLLKGKADLRVELYQSDRHFYLGVAPQVGYSQKDLLLGSPFGPNTQAFFGRFDYRVNDRIKTWMEVHDAVQYHSQTPDMGDRLLTAFGATWSPRPDQSVYVRLVPQRYRGINYVDRETSLDVVASMAF